MFSQKCASIQLPQEANISPEHKKTRLNRNHVFLTRQDFIQFIEHSCSTLFTADGLVPVYILHCPQRKPPRRRGRGRPCMDIGLSVLLLSMLVNSLDAAGWYISGSDGALTRPSWLRSLSQATMSAKTISTFSSGSPAVRPCHIPEYSLIVLSVLAARSYNARLTSGSVTVSALPCRMKKGIFTCQKHIQESVAELMRQSSLL